MAVSGERNRCPFCRASLWAPASERWSRKRCPRCGADLWVVAFTDGAMFFIRQPGESSQDFFASLVALIDPKLSASASQVEAAFESMDSLDIVELVIEVEEAMQSQQREPD